MHCFTTWRYSNLPWSSSVASAKQAPLILSLSSPITPLTAPAPRSTRSAPSPPRMSTTASPLSGTTAHRRRLGPPASALLGTWINGFPSLSSPRLFFAKLFSRPSKSLKTHSFRAQIIKSENLWYGTYHIFRSSPNWQRTGRCGPRTLRVTGPRPLGGRGTLCGWQECETSVDTCIRPRNRSFTWLNTKRSGGEVATAAKTKPSKH